MLQNKIKFLITICVVVCLSYKLTAQVIHIQTSKTSLVYGIHEKKIKQLHFGKILSSTNGIKDLSTAFDEIYPSFGNGSSNEIALIANHDDGTMATDLIYDSHIQNLEGNIQTTTIKLKDKKKPFFVELHFKSYQAENVIEQWATIHHKEKKQVKLQQFASAALGFKAESYYLTHFYGSWAQEMQLAEEKLTNGIKLIETKRGKNFSATYVFCLTYNF